MKFWQTSSTVDELENFLGTDEVTALNVGGAIFVVVFSILFASLAR
jgi:hypothetical protein